MGPMCCCLSVMFVAPLQSSITPPKRMFKTCPALTGQVPAVNDVDDELPFPSAAGPSAGAKRMSVCLSACLTRPVCQHSVGTINCCN